MVRTPTFDSNGIKKGAWSSEEDKKLHDYIINHGHLNWRELPKLAGLKRCGKSCRLRWMNYLKPNLKHGNFTKEEDDLITKLHEIHGNKWAMISSKLQGRTDNEIKNHWHTHLKKRVEVPKPTNSNKIHKSRKHNPNYNTSDDTTSIILSACDHIRILESCPLNSSKISPSSALTAADTTTTATTITISCDISSSFEIVNISDFGDGGLEEMMNSTDLFAEMSSLLENDDHDLLATYGGESSIQEIPVTNDNIYGEFEEDNFWSKTFNDNNQLLLSPCLNYYEESVFEDFDLLFEDTMKEIHALRNW